MVQESHILAQCPPGGLLADSVHVVWDPLPTQPLSACAVARMESQWQAALEDARRLGKTLFNGPVTQLVTTIFDPARQRIHLHLRPGTYREFLVTRLRDRAWFETHAPDACTPALGNSVLLTHNDHVLLGIRSRNVACYAGRAHLIGGVLDQLGTATLPATVDGLIEHLLIEVREEARVLPSDLAPPGPWPRLLGIFYDDVLGQPEAIWRWETRQPLEEIAHRLDPSEHHGHLLFRRGDKLPAEPLLTPLAGRAVEAWLASGTTSPES